MMVYSQIVPSHVSNTKNNAFFQVISVRVNLTHAIGPFIKDVINFSRFLAPPPFVIKRLYLRPLKCLFCNSPSIPGEKKKKILLSPTIKFPDKFYVFSKMFYSYGNFFTIAIHKTFLIPNSIIRKPPCLQTFIFDKPSSPILMTSFMNGPYGGGTCEEHDNTYTFLS